MNKKKTWRMFFYLGMISLIIVGIVTGHSVSGERKENVAAPSPAATIALGTSTLTGSYATGSSGQGIMHLTYQYTPLVSLTLNDVPLVIVQLPSEIGDQLAGNISKQTAFLNSLTGTIMYPQNLLSNLTFDMQATNSGVVKSYDEGTHSVVFTFPKSTTLLSLTNTWKVDMNLDAGVLYRNAISVPNPYNGTNYTAKGTLVSASEGINLITGNARTATITTASFGIGNYPVLAIYPPVLADTLSHLGTVISGNASQTLDGNYTYTADITYKTRAGATTKQTNLPVNASGIFTTTLAVPYEYGDTATAILRAKSKTNTDIYETKSSALITAKWPIQDATLNPAKVGDTQVTGVSNQTNPGIYKAHITINQTNYDVIPQVDGRISLAGIPALRSGDQVSIIMQGYSTRTGELLVSSASTTTTARYNSPSLAIFQKIERKNGSDVWEGAPSVASNQNIRYIATTTLQNANAIWMNQNVKIHIPSGLINISNITLTKISNGVTTQLTAPTMISDPTSPSMQSILGTVSNNPLTVQGDQIQLQYTATVASTAYPPNLTSTIFANGQTGNATAIPEISNSIVIPITDGTLKLLEVPSSITFTNIPIPSKPQIYNRTNATGTIKIRDGRVKKTPWQLYVREDVPLTNSDNQKLEQSLVYSQNNVDSILNASNQLIVNQSQQDDQLYEVIWQPTEGIRLKLAPSPNLVKNKQYTGKLIWTLADTPM
ncbi:WxL domain-containing protein [Listeria cornellensis]|uniref:WxL domain-containing protein n=1 Tax=Listeria cornellensis FSL F6-0969 TaxID=1265820 RepID=W7BQR4_9LIST|nr:WxL domain-containing protein [Listeria cornellensis]EUJ29114.1 hypothetical protein PCORN_11607 [Listeria cornellensis FSL F6-0969]